jgi:D-alanyl-D-alanine carboxypeptidase/D-alanyl-D-alanine-endopeptidase (penicillin-binding protein 4)
MKPFSRSAHNKFVSVLLMAVSLAAAAPAPATTTLAARIDAHIGEPRFAAADWGIAVVSLDDGRTLYTHRADRLLQPASTAKLFTAALALSTLGADYRLPTRLLAGGAIANGRLDGPLVLYGMGDPTLGTANTGADWADRLASQLAAHGVHRVRGNLIADDSYFRGPLIGTGWEAGDLQSAFAAPASALSVNENSVRVTVTPAARIGRPAQVTLDPADTDLRVENALVTMPARTPDDISLYRAPGATTLQAFGSVAMGAAPRHYSLSLPDPAAVAGAQLLQALRHRHIRVDGRLQVRHWPQGGDGLPSEAGVIAEVLSPPLGEILHSGLKRSQNLYLQNLLLAVGASPLADAPASTGFVGSEQRAIEMLHRLLDKIGVPPSASVLVEGSGLARRDLVTPNALVRLLVYLAAQPQAALLHESLPIAGVDGSLAWRMRDTAAQGNVHAKTGSMAYVQCLAGYVTSAAGERLAFAIMLNNYVPAPGASRPSAEVDAIAVMLANLAGRG